MKRFLVPLLLLVLLAACGRSGEFGNLKVTLSKPTVSEKQWHGFLEITNPTDQTQIVQYNPPNRYTMIVTRGGKEYYKGAFQPISNPDLNNILPGATQRFPVVWTFTDQTGKRVPPGTYQIKVALNAAAQGADKGITIGPIRVAVK